MIAFRSNVIDTALKPDGDRVNDAHDGRQNDANELRE